MNTETVTQGGEYEIRFQSHPIHYDAYARQMKHDDPNRNSQMRT